MKRRLVVLWLLPASHVGAQPAPARRLVAYLNAGNSARFDTGDVVLQELARLGWKQGVNLQFEARYAESQPQRLEALAREVVAMQPAVVVAGGTEATLALRRLSDRIPIVMANGTDPVAHGLAASLARPGGNVTGVVTMGLDIVPKLLQYALAVAPRARRADLLLNAANPNNPRSVASWQEAAAARGIEIVPHLVRDADDIARAVRAMTPVHEHVLVVGFDALLLQHAVRLAALARETGLPSVSLAVAWAADGGLLSYGPEWRDNFRRAAQLADKVLRGEKVGDIAIEQPTRIRLILNQRTARAIGLQFPQELLLRADEVID
jgi:putative tryptophan/tyrosine transport system substrate-binding protein